MSVDRSVFVYLVFGDNIHVIDSGVAGAESIICQYIQKQGREPKEIATLILTHSHPDHIGAAKSIKSETDSNIIAHRFEQKWIEDTEQQFLDRPVPEFHNLVRGSVGVDRIVDGGEILKLEKGIACKILHTPGHSVGSISILFEEDRSLLTADTLILPDDLPIYENIAECLSSIKVLQQIKNIENLFSSWEPPIQGEEKISKRMEASIAYLKRIHAAVISSNSQSPQDIMELCQKVASALGLPPFAVNLIVAKAFASSLYSD